MKFDALADLYGNAQVITNEAVMQLLQPPPEFDLTQYAIDNVVFGSDSPFPGPYQPDLFPWNGTLLDWLGLNHPARVITLKKSAQIGGTILINIFIGGWIDMAPRACMVVQPSNDNAERYSATKFKPFVRSTSSLSRVLDTTGVKSAKTTKLFMERYDGAGYVLFSGANSEASLSQISIRVQAQDDLTKWQSTKFGDSEGMSDARSSAFEDAKIFKNSTPGIKGICRIDKNYNRSSMGELHLPCPQCNHEAPLTWENFEKSNDFDIADASTVHFTCEACGFPILEKHRAEMVKKGRIVHAHPELVSSRPGLFIWSAYVAQYSWKRIYQGWVDARGTPDEEQQFFNDVLGLSYDIAGDAPPAEVLLERAEKTGHLLGTIPAGYPVLVAGADVQPDRIEITILGCGPNKRKAVVDYIVVEGNISDPHTQAELIHIFTKRQWPGPNGRSRGLDQIAVDTGNETAAVEDFLSQFSSRLVMGIKGNRVATAPPLKASKREAYTTTGKSVKKREKLWLVGGNYIKGWIYNDCRKEDYSARGGIRFAKGLGGIYFDQLTAEKKVLKRDNNGNEVIRYVNPNNARNEALDTFVYAIAAALRINVMRLTPDDWDRLIDERDMPLDNPQGDLLAPGTELKIPKPRRKQASSSTADTNDRGEFYLD